MKRCATFTFALTGLLAACGARSNALDDARSGSAASDDQGQDAGQALSPNGEGTSGGKGQDSKGTGETRDPNASDPDDEAGGMDSVTPGTTGMPTTTSDISTDAPDVIMPDNPVIISMPPSGSDAPIITPPDCDGTAYPTIENTDMLFPGVLAFATWGDGVTSLCIQQEPGRVCVSGTAGSSKSDLNDYEYWGAGFSIVLTPDVSTGLDLSAAGIALVKLTLTDVAGRPVRVMATQANDPALPPEANYDQNAFIWGGSSPKNIKTDSVLTIALSDFKLPAWTQVLDDMGSPNSGAILDARQATSLQVMAPNNPTDEVEPYGFCVEELQWLDAAGAPLPLPEPLVTQVDAGTAPTDEQDLPDQPDQAPHVEPPVDAGQPAADDAGAPAVSDAG